MLTGAVAREPRPAPRHPRRVAPLVVRLPHHRRGRRRVLGARRERIGLVARDAVGADDRELVARAVADAGHHALPDPGRLARRQAVAPAVPAVPVADHAHRARVGRPHREVGPAVDDVRAELVVQPVVRALVEQEQIVGGEQRLHVRAGYPPRRFRRAFAPAFTQISRVFAGFPLRITAGRSRLPARSHAGGSGSARTLRDPRRARPGPRRARPGSSMRASGRAHTRALATRVCAPRSSVNHRIAMIVRAISTTDRRPTTRPCNLSHSEPSPRRCAAR